MKREKIVEILTSGKVGNTVLVKGWVRAFRSNRFIQVNDGSTIKNIQAVVDFENFDEAILKRVTTGAAIEIKGVLVESQGAGQAIEIQVEAISILGDAHPDDIQKTVMQPKKHSLEFLREQAHLRFRTNTFGAVFRIRHAVAFAIHKYFNDRGFFYLHTPIITGSDAEGAGEMFRVTNLNLYDLPVLKDDKGKQPRYVEVHEATKHIAEKYAKCILDFLQEDHSDYYKRDIEYIKSSDAISKILEPEQLNKLIQSDLRELNQFKQSYERIIKANYSDKPDAIIGINEMTSKLFLKIKNYFKEGKLKNYDLRELKKDLKKVEKEKGWKFDFDESHYKMDEMPLFILSFYNLFKVYNHDYIDFKEDFFGKAVNLTVSGQLEAELGAMALGQVYTFGPTFRAENSNTSRHLAEFWMIEPEVAFNDLKDNMDLTEDFLKYIANYVLTNCADDLQFLNDREEQEQKSKPQNERNELGLIERLKFVIENDFKRLTYTEAIDVLRNSKPYQKGKFQYDVEWGIDLQSEHERYLVEKEFKCPVILTDYPAKIKAFYMRQNDDGKTVAAMDVLFPGIGEIVGGSQREERLDILKSKMADFNIHEDELSWYLDTRKFGTAPHAGFGLGFERMVMFVTGMTNIRDVIPFPRTPLNAEF